MKSEKYRIKERPTGYISVNGGPLQPWPQVGELVDLAPEQAADMIRAGHVEAVVETRPAPTAAVETRTPAKKSAAKGVESRKG